MGILTLNCLVRGGDIGTIRIFEVKISRTETVAALKKAIKNKKPVAFRGVDASTLDLYKPRDPLPLYKKNLSTIVLSEHAECLEVALDELSEVFPKAPLERHIHIIVDAPETIVCWFRGRTLSARLPISIRPGEYTDQLIRHIKDAQPNLRDNHISLYRISGDDDELQESLNKTGDGELLQGDTLLPHFLGVPVLDPLHVVVEVTSSTPSNPPLLHEDLKGEEDQIAMEHKVFIDKCPEKWSSSDGSRPPSVRDTQREQDKYVPCGRPHDPQERIPVALLHPVFGQFVDDCKTVMPTADDNQFVGWLANVMSDFYQNDAQRLEAVHEVFKEANLGFIIYQKIPGTNYEMDASLSVYDPELPPYFIAEFGNEVTASMSKSCTQTVSYYLEATKTHAPVLLKSALPCFLLEVFGPYMAFSGAVWNLRPVVQVLSTPLAFFFHSTDTYNQLTVARHMAAFRKALKTLKAYYEDISGDKTRLVNKNESPDMLFPYYTEFRSLEDESTQTIYYTRQLDKGGDKMGLVFFGTLEGDPRVQICIKFTHRYSKEAHLHCAELGFAPKLRGFEVLPGGWYMIVMDDLVGYDLLADLPDTDRLPRSVFEAIGTQLRTLHARQMVHGDIRDTNILVKKDDRTQFMIIDFDWAGVEDVVEYPPLMNHTNVQRPEGARDGLPIKAAHDLEMLDVITETWAAKSL